MGKRLNGRMIALILEDPASGLARDNVFSLGMALLKYKNKSRSPNAAFLLMQLNRKGCLIRRLFTPWLMHMKDIIKQDAVTFFVVGKLKELYTTKAEVVAALDVAEFQQQELVDEGERISGKMVNLGG